MYARRLQFKRGEHKERTGVRLFLPLPSLLVFFLKNFLFFIFDGSHNFNSSLKAIQLVLPLNFNAATTLNGRNTRERKKSKNERKYGEEEKKSGKINMTQSLNCALNCSKIIMFIT